MGVDDVKRRGDRAHHHADDQECKKYIGQQPAISHHVAGSPPESIEPNPTEDELEDHEQNPELGLILAVVEPNHQFVHRVGKQPGQNQTHNGADEGPRVEITGLVFLEPQWWPEKHNC